MTSLQQSLDFLIITRISCVFIHSQGQPSEYFGVQSTVQFFRECLTLLYAPVFNAQSNTAVLYIPTTGETEIK